MNVTAPQTVRLITATGLVLGELHVDEVRDELLLGTFTPGADYEKVRPIFDEFAEAVEGFAISIADIYAEQIAALGIRLADGTPLWDVQIYPDGAASVRVGERVDQYGAH